MDRETEMVKEAHLAGDPSLSGRGGSVWAVSEEGVRMAYDTFRALPPRADRDSHRAQAKFLNSRRT